MNEKFKDLSTDEGTKIIFRSSMKWKELDIVYEKWYWEGINAESVIFLSEDVKDMDNDDLEKEVRASPLIDVDSQVTIKRGEKFTFVNFNFSS